MIHLKLKFILKCSNMYEKEHEENLLSALFVFISLDMLLSDKLGLSVLFRPGKMFPSFPADHTTRTLLTHTHTHADSNKCQNIKYQNSSYTYKFIHKQEAVLMRIMNETLQTFLNSLGAYSLTGLEEKADRARKDKSPLRWWSSLMDGLTVCTTRMLGYIVDVNELKS